MGIAPEAETTSLYRRFAQHYRNDPVAFVSECFLWRAAERPAPYQEEILAALPVKKRMSARGPHGLGKTTQAAWLVWWFALTRDAGDQNDWKIVTTASAWRQLEKYLWPEIHKWSRRLRWDVIGLPNLDARGKLLGLSIKLRNGEAFAVASDNHELIEGAHADSILYIFDESKAISPKVFDAAEGAFSTADAQPDKEAFAFAISTPGTSHGRFYEIQSRKAGYEDWGVRHVTLDEAIAAGRIGRAWADSRKLQWGEDSAVYKNRVLGEFAANDETGIIPLEWVEAANLRWEDWKEGSSGLFPESAPYVVGVDVARGGDKTILAIRKGRVLVELRTYDEKDTMVIVGRVNGAMGEAHSGKAVVDVIGLGAGVVDRLREQGQAVIAFHGAEHTDFRDESGELGFVNVRSAAWWHLRELLDPHNPRPIALPRDDQLIGDLTTPQYRIMSGGKIQLESKQDTRDEETDELKAGIRKRLGRSTDKGDAVVMAYWLPSQFVSYSSIVPRRYSSGSRGAY